MAVPEVEIAGNAVRIGIGKGAVGGAGDSFRATLGSCVGACIVWPNAGRFGLVHVLLPHAERAVDPSSKNATRFADSAIPWLLERLEVTAKARRELVAYIAGGANMFSGSNQQTQVGMENRESLLDALRRARVRVKGEDMGGDEGRQLIVHGPQQRVFSMRLSSSEIINWPMPPTFTPKVG